MEKGDPGEGRGESRVAPPATSQSSPLLWGPEPCSQEVWPSPGFWTSWPLTHFLQVSGQGVGSRPESLSLSDTP